MGAKTKKKKTWRIGLVCPVECEFQACKAHLRLSDEIEIAGRRFAFRNTKQRKLTVVNGLLGKAFCASSTQLMIDKFGVNLVIDVGTAGSLDPAVNIGDIVVGRVAYEYDVGSFMISPKDKLDEIFIAETLLCQRVTQNKLENLRSFFRVLSETNGIKIHFGDLVCGDKPIGCSNIKAELKSHYPTALACDWETAAILKVATLNKVAGLSFRVVTDNADGKDKDEWRRNSTACLSNLFLVLKEFLASKWLDVKA